MYPANTNWSQIVPKLNSKGRDLLLVIYSLSSDGGVFDTQFVYLRPLANSAMMSTLTAHCQWEEETVRERIGRPPSYAVAKKMKSLTLHTHGCLRVSLRD